MRRQTELVTEEQRKDVLDRKISVCKDLEVPKCMVCFRNCRQVSMAAASLQGWGLAHEERTDAESLV